MPLSSIRPQQNMTAGLSGQEWKVGGLALSTLSLRSRRILIPFPYRSCLRKCQALTETMTTAIAASASNCG